MVTSATLRPVTTFVRRSPRMNESQRAAWQRLSGRYLVDGLRRGPMQPLFVPQPPLDVDGLFGRPAPLIVEIGAGSGENLAAVAQARPECNVLGFEVYDKVIGSTMSRLERAEAPTIRRLHVRLIDGDAVTGLEHLFAPGSIAELHTYFPDPWHKSRHIKRRLINPAFVRLAASRLAPAALWRLATDWDDYAGHIRQVFAEAGTLFDDLYPAGAPRDAIRPLTKFEGRAIAAGRPVTDFVFRRTAPQQVRP